MKDKYNIYINGGINIVLNINTNILYSLVDLFIQFSSRLPKYRTTTNKPKQ